MAEIMTPARLKSLRMTYQLGLLDDVIPFWSSRSHDSKYGGFQTSLNREGEVVDTDKSIWQQGRAAWLYSALCNRIEDRDSWRQLAASGIHFLDEHGQDPSDGRFWFLVESDGTPLRKRRYSFSEAFAAIAYGEYAKLTSDERYVLKARAAFEQFIHHSKGLDPSLAKFTDHRKLMSIGIPMITIATAQVLRQAINLDGANEVIDQAIEQIRNFHMDHELQCVLELVEPDGTYSDHFDGRTLNPGHAIEAAWFILAEGKLRSDDELIQVGCQILDWMWQRGWDQQYGGILYFVSADDRPVQEYWHDMKFWWPQCETIIATLLAYQLTNDEKYADWHSQIHDWTHELFPDPDHGEWFGYFHRDGRLSQSVKGNHWKGPFHIPRMQLECLEIVSEMLGLTPTENQKSDNA